MGDNKQEDEKILKHIEEERERLLKSLAELSDKLVDDVVLPKDLRALMIMEGSTKEELILKDADGKEHKYSQYAVVPYNDMICCIIKPITKVDGIDENEAIVCALGEDGEGNQGLQPLNDLEDAKAAFALARMIMS